MDNGSHGTFTRQPEAPARPRVQPGVPKILMLAYACNPKGGGEHWLGWGWAEQAAKNFSVHFLTPTNYRTQIEKHAPRHGLTPYFSGLPDSLRKVSERLGGLGRWWRKIVWQLRAAKLAETLHAQEKFQLVHQTTFHTFRVPFLAARLGIPSVWGPVAGGESVPPGFGGEPGAARFGETGRRLVNKFWQWFPPVRRSLARAGVIFVSNRTTLDFLPATVRSKCVIVSPNALRPDDEAVSFGVPPSGGPSSPAVRPPEGGTPNPDRGNLRRLYGGMEDALLEGQAAAENILPSTDSRQTIK